MPFLTKFSKAGKPGWGVPITRLTPAEKEFKQQWLNVVSHLRTTFDTTMLEPDKDALQQARVVFQSGVQAALARGGNEGQKDIRQAVRGLRNPKKGRLIRKAVATAAEIPFNFEMTNPLVMEYVQSQTGELITHIDDDTRAAVQRIISSAYFKGIPPDQAGKLIQPVVGLTGRWAQAAVNYQAGLVASGMDTAKAEALYAAYADRLLAQRGELIARTELLSAENAGRSLAWDQAIAQGLISTDTHQKEWVATPDERECPICEDLDGEQVGLNDAFSSGDDMPPAHPDCRCTAVLAETGDELPEGGVLGDAAAALDALATDTAAGGDLSIASDAESILGAANLDMSTFVQQVDALGDFDVWLGTDEAGTVVDSVQSTMKVSYDDAMNLLNNIYDEAKQAGVPEAKLWPQAYRSASDYLQSGGFFNEADIKDMAVNGIGTEDIASTMAHFGLSMDDATNLLSAAVDEFEPGLTGAVAGAEATFTPTATQAVDTSKWWVTQAAKDNGYDSVHEWLQHLEAIGPDFAAQVNAAGGFDEWLAAGNTQLPSLVGQWGGISEVAGKEALQAAYYELDGTAGTAAAVAEKVVPDAMEAFAQAFPTNSMQGTITNIFYDGGVNSFLANNTYAAPSMAKKLGISVDDLTQFFNQFVTEMGKPELATGRAGLTTTVSEPAAARVVPNASSLWAEAYPGSSAADVVQSIESYGQGVEGWVQHLGSANQASYAAKLGINVGDVSSFFQQMMEETSVTVAPEQAAAVATSEAGTVPIASPEGLPFNPEDLKLADSKEQISAGMHVKTVYQADDGSLWMFKESVRSPYQAYADEFASNLRAALGLDSTPTVVTEMNGKFGSLQKLYADASARRDFFKGAIDVSRMSADQVATFQKDQVFDWLIGNSDAHAGQYIRVSGSMNPIETDFGQAFKFFGQDRLDYAYTPNPEKAVSSLIDQAYAEGRSIQGFQSLAPGSENALREFVQQVSSLSDADYKAILRPYAESAKAANTLPGGDIESFLNAAVERKNTLERSFEEYHTRLDAERTAARQEMFGDIKPPEDFHAFKTFESGDQWGVRVSYSNLSDGLDKLDPKVYREVRRYTGNGYTDMNIALRRQQELLRAGEPGTSLGAQMEARVELMDTGMDFKPTPDDIVVHRASNLEELNAIKAQVGEQMVGGTYVDGGFMSTSLGPKSAFGSGTLNLEIQVPAGTPSAYVNLGVSSHISEYEMILGRGLSYRVLSYDVVSGQTHLVVQVVAGA